MLWTNKCLRTDGQGLYYNTARHNTWISDAYGQLSCDVVQEKPVRWVKNWNAQVSFDTTPEISQSASVYAARIRSNAPSWKCLVYPVEHVVKDKTDFPKSSSYLDLYLAHDINVILATKLYDKSDDFNFPIVNYPFPDSIIPSSPASRRTIVGNWVFVLLLCIYHGPRKMLSWTINNYDGYVH